MALPDAVQVLCDRCLGRRLIGAAGVEPQRAEAQTARTWSEVAEKDCPVCEGAFLESDAWLRVALDAAKPYQFRTFQVGTQFPISGEALERELSAAMGQGKVGESIRTEANRALTAAFAAATGAAAVQEGRPELVLKVDTRYHDAEVDPAPVFVRGRYTKHRRDIPQTHWPCRRCQGLGCWQCNDTGVTYAESVEDAVGIPALPLFSATGYAFHGAGREDIDALMVGTGRPFILELKGPKRRVADLPALAGTVNAAMALSGVAVRDLRMAAAEEVAAIKAADYAKEYLAHCVAEAPLARSAVLDAAARLSGATLEQRTPDRVAHRRADLVRKRTVHRVAVERMEGDASERFSLRVLAESGTYIKEFVSSDEGRTQPSVSAALGLPVKVEFLDVVAILDAPQSLPAPI
ncbi:MAG TPA: tRNA pseudouridine(54/55) synthase Pus10 [Candidatus Thermoplasmatota archaeon]|nr:tRNA pseudouridine(54/55) synthase Pus10 [Candidatus Thermoplasmatota archaeon]